MYLSSLQVGLQTAHVTAEMAAKYLSDNEEGPGNMFYNWAEQHKTMILLNGGYAENLHDLYDFFSTEKNPYPFAKFHESKAAMDGMLTSVGIVLPEKIYEGAAAMRKIKRLRMDDNARLAWDLQQVLTIRIDGILQNVDYTNFEVELMERLSTFRLAS